MAGNISPIYSRVGDVEGGVILFNAAGDFNGQNANNKIIFQANPDNGGFVQRLRFKAVGTNVATVARIYINQGFTNIANSIPAPSGLTGTAGTLNGSLLNGTFFAKVQSVDQWGAYSPMSAESSGVSVTGPTGNVTWSWAGVAGAQYYRLFVGGATNSQVIYFNTTGNVVTFIQNTATVNLTTNMPARGNPEDFISQNFLYGELSLPATTFSAISATSFDIDYPINIAIPPSYHIVVGLGTSVANGWQVTAVGGQY